MSFQHVFFYYALLCFNSADRLFEIILNKIINDKISTKLTKIAEKVSRCIN